jgi:hypothetical protein
MYKGFGFEETLAQISCLFPSERFALEVEGEDGDAWLTEVCDGKISTTGLSETDDPGNHEW